VTPRREDAFVPRDVHDDVEILEVVGLDEEGREPEPEAGGEADVEVLFEEAPRPGPVPPPRAVDEPSHHDRYLRLRADFENLKRRAEQERAEHTRRANETLVSRLLPVLDNVERALAASVKAAPTAMRDGLALIQRQLMDELGREGLRPVEAVGRLFDPHLHDAVATAQGSGLPPHTVVEELQRGYFFRDRLLRPALVRVQVDAAEGEES
jgi:molecular chaperone GrpE